MRLILANPVMIKAYREGVPANGKPFPGGSKIAKIEWQPKSITDAPFSAATPDTVPGSLKEVEFIQKDSKRFADSNGGWGYAAFTFDDASNTFIPPLVPVTSAGPLATSLQRQRTIFLRGTRNDN
jgi:hypothetical protein